MSSRQVVAYQEKQDSRHCEALWFNYLNVEFYEEICAWLTTEGNVADSDVGLLVEDDA